MGVVVGGGGGGSGGLIGFDSVPPRPLRRRSGQVKTVKVVREHRGTCCGPPSEGECAQVSAESSFAARSPARRSILGIPCESKAAC